MAKNPRTEEQKIAHSISEKKRYQAGKEAKAKKEEEASKKKAEKAAEKAFKMRESRAKKKAETEAGIKVAEAAVQEALCKSSMDAGIASLNVGDNCHRRIILYHIV